MAHLSQVELQHVADVMWVEVGQLHQVLAVLKRLAELFHAGLGPVHTVNALYQQQ